MLDRETEEQFLRRLRRHQPGRVRTVRFRPNRSTIWSLTQRGTVLNLHDGYRGAPEAVVRAFATIAREAGRRTTAYREAARTVRSWPGIDAALVRARRASSQEKDGSRPDAARNAAGTDAQRRYLRRLYRYLNHTRFGGCLPDDIPLRLSRRMTTRLGHMAVCPGRGRRVQEIALNLDLMLPGNGAARLDTLLHEMAHAAAYLFDGDAGHGASWRAWARRVGCEPSTCIRRPVRRRRARGKEPTHVPRSPPAAVQTVLRI